MIEFTHLTKQTACRNSATGATAPFVSKLKPPGNDRRLLSKVGAALLSIEQVGFFESDLLAKQANIGELGMPVDFGIGNSVDVLKVHANTLRTEFSLDSAKVEDRLRKGHIPILAVSDGVLVSMAWLAFNDQYVREVGKQMVLRAGEVLSYNEQTSIQWRGRGISPHLNQFADRFSRGRGAQRRINWRLLLNRPAVRVASKLGDRRFAVVTAVRVASLPNVWVFGEEGSELDGLLRRTDRSCDVAPE